MKKARGMVFAIVLGSFALIGCGSGPGVGSDQEAKDSMDASMKIDTMAETNETDTATPTTP